MGYAVVTCPKGHVKPTRAKSFRCHGKLFDTSSHILEVTKKPAEAPKPAPAKSKPTPKATISAPLRNLKPEPLKVEVNLA